MINDITLDTRMLTSRNVRQHYHQKRIQTTRVCIRSTLFLWKTKCCKPNMNMFSCFYLPFEQLASMKKHITFNVVMLGGTTKTNLCLFAFPLVEKNGVKKNIVG